MLEAFTISTLTARNRVSLTRIPRTDRWNAELHPSGSCGLRSGSCGLGLGFNRRCSGHRWGVASVRQHGRRRVVRAALVAVMAGVATSCAFFRAHGPPLPPQPQMVHVTMDEFNFLYSPPTSPGRVLFTVGNVGQDSHEMVIVSLPEDFPPLNEQLQSDTRRPVETIAVLPERLPGGTGQIAVDLAPGRYGMICFVRDPSGKTHAAMGMSSEFRISGMSAAESDLGQPRHP